MPTVKNHKHKKYGLIPLKDESNYDIWDRGVTDPKYKNMGTTVVGAHFDDGHVAIAHVGDSRVYLVRDGFGITGWLRLPTTPPDDPQQASDIRGFFFAGD